ncbi:hypothetical protein [Halalkalibacter okhensis]|uniref:hypothetical protein n=1 Tax=Halalkalibacter okhensis TaxID=333138 RepID=UPI000A51D960|nr:hypothetical protein [Halalkalibacter okhensis]
MVKALNLLLIVGGVACPEEVLELKSEGVSQKGLLLEYPLSECPWRVGAWSW